MALPAVAAGAARLYGQLSSPAKTGLVNWLKKTTKGIVSNGDSVAKYAGQGEASAVVVAEGLVRYGAPYDVVAALFANTPNGAQIRASLVDLGRSLLTANDEQRPGLSASVPDTANDVMRAELIKSLVRHFGSVSNARKVQMAFATLKASDFEWYEAVQPSLRY